MENDFDNWQKFKVGYIKNNNKKLGTGLFQIVNSVPYHNKDIMEKENGLNYVTRSKFNNGIKCKVVKHEEFTVNPAGTISFGAENANFFYQKEEYITGNKIYYLDTQCLSEYSAMFLQSVLEETFSNNFSFSDGLIPTRIYNEDILLPATPSGDPDWVYMEAYMKEMEEKAKERLDRLEEMRKQEKKKIDVTGWGEFKVGDLFDVSISKSIDKTYLNFIDDGEIEYIGRTAVNNGIQGKMNVLDNIIPNQHNVFSLAQIGDNVCLFRETPWYSSQNIFILHPKYKKIIAVEKFVSTVITKIMLSVYGCDAYASYPTLKTLKDVTLLLPVTSDGSPDWGYMEQYMRKMEEKARKRLERLVK